MKPGMTSRWSPDRIERAVRQRYSPMPELTMDGLVEVLNSFRIGELRAAARIWEIMIERDGELAANIAKRVSDSARCEWEIQTTEDSPAAEAQKEALVYAYDHLRTTSVLDQNESGGIRTLIRQMLLAHAHRYSVHELLLRVDGAGAREVTIEARHCPVWFFEGRKGRLQWLTDDYEIYGQPMAPGEWLVTVGSGFMRQASVAYLAKWHPLSHWMSFAARFGIPGVHGQTDAAKGSQEWDDFAEALTAFANDWVTLTNRSATINLVEAKGGGSTSLPFPALVEMSDRLYAKLFRGADLATQSRGAESMGASVQTDEIEILLRDDCELINETLNEQIDRPLIRYLFGTEPLAYFRINPPKPHGGTEDRENASFLIERGCQIGKRAAMQRLGWTEPEEGDEPLEKPVPPPAAPALNAPPVRPQDRPALGNAGLEDRGRAELGRAMAADLAPLRRRLAAIEKISDPDIRKARLEALIAEWDTLAKDILADPETAQAIRRVAGAAVVTGLTSGESES